MLTTLYGLLVFLACVVAFSVGLNSVMLSERKQPKLEPIAITEAVQKVVDKAEARKRKTL